MVKAELFDLPVLGEFLKLGRGVCDQARRGDREGLRIARELVREGISSRSSSRAPDSADRKETTAAARARAGPRGRPADRTVRLKRVGGGLFPGASYSVGRSLGDAPLRNPFRASRASVRSLILLVAFS